jgi:hypothetical protein
MNGGTRAPVGKNRARILAKARAMLGQIETLQRRYARARALPPGSPGYVDRIEFLEPPKAEKAPA